MMRLVLPGKPISASSGEKLRGIDALPVRGSGIIRPLTSGSPRELSGQAGARTFPYIYFWNRMERKGQACAVLARGKMNSCLVLFEDGFKAITSRNAIRRRPEFISQDRAE